MAAELHGTLKARRDRLGEGKRLRALETQNEERNEPIRRLNERFGYVVTPGSITVRGPVRAAESMLSGGP